MNSGSLEFQAGQAELRMHVGQQLADVAAEYAGSSPRVGVGYRALQTLLTLPAEIGTPLDDDPDSVAAFQKGLSSVNHIMPISKIVETENDQRKLGMGALCVSVVGGVGASTVAEAFSRVHPSRRELVCGSCVVSPYCPIFRTLRASRDEQSEAHVGGEPTLRVDTTLRAIRRHLAGLSSAAAPEEPRPTPTKRKR